MSDEIQSLRDVGRYLEAVALLKARVVEQPREGQEARKLYRRHVLGERCLLLETARRHREAPETPDKLRQLVREAGFLPTGYVALSEARLAVIEAALNPKWDIAEIQKSLADAVEQYSECWGYDRPKSTPAVQRPAGEPALLGRLPRHQNRMRKAVRCLAGHFGWQHPGLLLAAETVAYIWQTDDRLPCEHKVRTWVLMAVTNPLDGIPARLHVERVRNGCGVLYPHPLAGAYTWTKTSFQDGLKNARLAALHDSAVCEYDFRWWLDLADPATGLPQYVCLEGHSAELAFAAAIKAAALGEDLDQHVASTACLSNAAGGDFSLETVGSVAVKAGGVLQRLKNVAEILVANGQQVALEGTAAVESQVQRLTRGVQNRETLKVGNGELQIVPCCGFNEAYDLLSRWPRITRHVNERLKVESANVLKSCDHVPSALSRRMPATAPPEARGEGWNWESLDKDEESVVVKGELPVGKNRVRVFGISGLGKTTFLYRCEQHIAAGQDGRLPVRVDRLSGVVWENKREDVLAKLLERHLEVHLPEDVQGDEKYEWLKQLVARGQVVFLLDALDQTNEKLNVVGLADFLKSVWNCPVIITGRDYVENSRAFSTADWLTLRVDPFDERRQRRFLGKFADRLLPTDDERRENRTSYERKAGWADLLKVPLLLHLMRRLAESDELEGLKNGEVYDKAFQELTTRPAHVAVSYPPGASDQAAKRPVLERAALELFSKMTGKSEFSFDGDSLLEAIKKAAKAEKTKPSGSVAGAVKDDLVLNSGILRGDATRDRFWFLHPFHEFLTASALARMVNEPGGKGWARQLTLAGRRHTVRKWVDKKAWDPRWHEVLTVLAGKLNEPLPLLELLGDERSDDCFCHRRCLAACCLTEISEPLRLTCGLLVDQVTRSAIAQWESLPVDPAGDFLPLAHCLQALARINLGSINGWLDEKLSEPDRSVPCNAIAMGGLVGAVPAATTTRSQLLSLLAHGKGAVRLAAAEALGRIGSETSDPALLAELSRRLRTRSPNEQAAAARALGRFGAAAVTEKVLDGLLDLLCAKVMHLQDEAVTALAELGRTASRRAEHADVAAKLFAKLGELLKNPDPYKKTAAIQALVRLGLPRVPEATIAKLVQLFRGWVTSTWDPVLFWATRAVGQIRALGDDAHVRGRMLELLADPDPHQSVASARALGDWASSTHHQETIKALRSKFSDNDWKVRWWAARGVGVTAIAALGDPELKRLFQDLSKTFTEHDTRIKASALRALGWLEPRLSAVQIEDVLGKLGSILTSSADADLLAAAAEAAGRIGPRADARQDLPQEVESLLREDNPVLRYWAAWAIGEIGPPMASPSVVERLVGGLKDPDSQAQTAVRHALGKLMAQEIRILRTRDGSIQVRSVAELADP